MASKNMGLLLVLAVAMLCSGAAAQSSPCTNLIVTLSPCIDYVAGNASAPASDCCSNFANVVSSNPECLCESLSMNSSLGIAFNQTKVIALPGACNTQIPDLSTCNADSPANSPAGEPTTGSGSNTAPSTQGGGSSDASSTKMSISLFFVLFVASFAMH